MRTRPEEVLLNNPEQALTLRMIPALSSCTAAEGLARTTNAVEGWHLGVTSLFQGNHPCIWTFLEKISLGAAKQKFNIISFKRKGE